MQAAPSAAQAHAASTSGRPVRDDLGVEAGVGAVKVEAADRSAGCRGAVRADVVDSALTKKVAWALAHAWAKGAKYERADRGIDALAEDAVVQEDVIVDLCIL